MATTADPHINPQTGVWDDNFYAQQQAKSNPTGGTGFSVTDPQAAIQAATKQYQDANAPAIASYQAQVPEVTQKYDQARTALQSQQQPLQDRYAALLDSIKNQQSQAVNSQTTITNNELGKRGITGSSGLAQQDIQNAVAPINSQYTNLTAQTTGQENSDILNLQNQIAGLAPQETADQRAISQAIAGLTSNAGAQGVSSGLNLYSTQLQNQQQQAALQQQANQQSAQNALAQLVQQQNNANDQKQIGISQQNADTSAGNLGLAQNQFDYTKSLNDPATIQKLFQALGIGSNQSTTQSNPGMSQPGRYSLVP